MDLWKFNLIMPEEVNRKTIFSLLEVSKSIQKTLSERYQQIYWVKAEMNRLNLYPHSGHCYPELVQKAAGKIIAEMKGIIWREDYLRISSMFLRVLREPLKDGVTILFAARITYDPVYGLSLRILDIDPSYSLGELEREKYETIQRLQEEKIYDLNRSLEPAMLPRRIAIISVQTSKGYADFINILEKNPYGYRFFHMLFPAVLQGDKAVDSILYQMERIRKVVNHFDALAIIRGGGGDVGLNCYNSYLLASEVARFPLPVLTGIGHSTNETVTELVAHKNAITPSELADFLIQSFHNFAVPLQRATEKIAEKSVRMIENEKSGLLHNVRLLKSITSGKISNNRTILQNSRASVIADTKTFLRGRHEKITEMTQEINKKVSLIFQHHHRQVEHLGQKTALLDPVNVLKRGYSITFSNGKSVRSVDEIDEGDPVTTRLADGVITSTVTGKEHERGN